MRRDFTTKDETAVSCRWSAESAPGYCDDFANIGKKWRNQKCLCVLRQAEQ